jgi:pyruvate dehydrogenase E2 component (dihydrolipoamide acetyltransferase)/2-oxoglutarate dehydrogenase E2 component (dihydrolipoamide succinyltransferase)
MSFEVIMPALGMAQDTGLLVAWHKAPGDAVMADDILMEVETDKSVMEVAAGHNGFIAELRAAAGDKVPVGNVVALISAEKPAVAQRRSAPAAESCPAAEHVEMPAASTARAPQAAMALKSAVPPIAAVLLASPKAKRLAQERGLDLSLLVARGVPQPYHVSDLEVLAALQEAVPHAKPAPQPQTFAMVASQISARFPAAGLEAFLARVRTGGRIEIEPQVMIARFCAAGLRAILGAEQIVVAVEAYPSGRRVLYADPDRCAPSRPRLAARDIKPDILVRDLTGSRITAVSLSGDGMPVLSLNKLDGNLEMSFAFNEARISASEATGLIGALAERLNRPLEYLI